MYTFNAKTNSFELKLTPKQEQFAQLPDSIFEALYGGGNGSGKSFLLLMYGVLRRWTENPKFKQVFMRRTFPELKNEILPRSREIYPKLGATLNKTEMCWTFPRPDQYGSGYNNSGAMIFFGHCETNEDASKYDSMEINLFTPDEITSFTDQIYLHVGFTRVRSNDVNLPAIIRAAGMPGGQLHTFVKKRFIDPCPEGGKVIIGRGNIKRIYIHATVADNKYADQSYSARLDGIPSEAERRARKYGDWDAYQGQVFSDFRDVKYPDEPENAIHVIEPFEIPAWWPRFVVGDWGYTALTYILFCAVSPTGRLYLYRELSYLKTRISEWAPEVKYYIEQENPITIKFCKSAGQNRGQEHTIQGDIETHLGRSIELTDNTPGSRLSGKMLIHEYIRWSLKSNTPEHEKPVYNEDYAQWLLRNKSQDDYTAYLDMFNDKAEDVNIPKLQIFRCNESRHDGHPNCCPLVIDAIKAATYEKEGSDGKPAEDVMEWHGDDPYDTLRYAVDCADTFIREAGSRFIRVVRQQQLVDTLKMTGNWTAYFRQMEHSEQTKPMQVVRRYRH